jgi:hypothetical protein
MMRLVIESPWTHHGSQVEPHFASPEPLQQDPDFASLEPEPLEPVLEETETSESWIVRKQLRFQQLKTMKNTMKLIETGQFIASSSGKR